MQLLLGEAVLCVGMCAGELPQCMDKVHTQAGQNRYTLMYRYACVICVGTERCCRRCVRFYDWENAGRHSL